MALIGHAQVGRVLHLVSAKTPGGWARWLALQRDGVILLGECVLGMGPEQGRFREAVVWSGLNSPRTTEQPSSPPLRSTGSG